MIEEEITTTTIIASPIFPQQNETEYCQTLGNNYTCPFPNSKFYIEVERDKCRIEVERDDPKDATTKDATTLKSFSFNYRTTETYGSGWLSTPSIDGQPLLGVAEAGVIVKEELKTSEVNVRLTTDLQINKYITKVEHVGEEGVIFDPTTNRIGESSRDKLDEGQILTTVRSRKSNSNNTRDWKNLNTVKVERGDLVTYNIDVINNQSQEVSFQVKDILPHETYENGPDARKCYDEKFDPDIQKWLTVKGNETKTITVTLRPTAKTGIWENTAIIKTSNSGDEDYNRTNYSSDSSDPRHNGRVVNVAELDGGILEDSDFYEIKEYNINIDKYIYDVEHEKEYVGKSGIDTTIPAVEDRRNKSSRSAENTMITEDVKRENPVYVEYGDKVTYKINIYNTTKLYDENIDRSAAPYWNPDKVYVNIQDILPEKYSNLEIEVSNDAGIISYVNHRTNENSMDSVNLEDGPDSFIIRDIMVPADGVTTVTVSLVVEEHERSKIETNSVSIIDQDSVEVGKETIRGIKNINKGIDRYCVIQNHPLKTETKDYYILNDYNAFIDKYLYAYDENVKNENLEFGLSAEQTLVEDNNVLIDFQNRENLEARERLSDSIKQNNPVYVEKGEVITYQIKVTNEAETENEDNSISTAIKPATQVRTTEITDYMQKGIGLREVKATHYNADGTLCTRYNLAGELKVNSLYDVEVSQDGRTYFKWKYYLSSESYEVILNPGEYIIYTITADVLESDLYLYDLDNIAEIAKLTNINHVPKYNKNREIQNHNYNENISEQQESHEYVRMKDLIIAGKVWLDFNKNGLMDDTVTDYINQTKDLDADKLSEYYNINENAMMANIPVKLYKSDGTLVRTTKTDSNGLFTFSRNEDGSFYETQYYNLDPSRKYSPEKTYERIDKATGKDANGNYKEGSQYISYYIEYEYDGVIYKATAYSGKDHLNNDGSYKGADCGHSFETNVSSYATNDYKKELKPSENYKYEYDSNANEFVGKREEFNEKYEYITYDKAYDISYDETVQNGTNTSDLDFDKNGHTSHLLVNPDRVMTARSFIEEISQPNTQEATNFIPLFAYNNSDYTKPYSRYLKFINLGLELREDVDISLTKDVYKVKTTIKGEEMEYNFNNNFIINGEVLDGNAVNNYKFDHPYGIELYESDYKFRNEQYSSIEAVKKYFGENAELNVEVTYRIRVDNNKVNKDGDLSDFESLDSGYDKKNFENTEKVNRYVKIDEILDLYDENFIEYTPEMEEGTEDSTIKVKQVDSNTGRFDATDKEINVAEAWYYVPDNAGKYILDNETNIYVYTSEENVNEQRYRREELKVSNTSINDSTNEYINNEKYKTDGYNKLYITGMGEVKIQEGEHLDIFVKYVVDKGSEEITVKNDSWEETTTNASEAMFKDVSYDETTGKLTYTWGSSNTETVSKESAISMLRSLIIKEHTDTDEKRAYGLGTENIAQVNLYSVWYAESDKPASIVDKDSNVGNVGIKDNDKVVDSADNKQIYEDTMYKTGINITAEGTANAPGSMTETIIQIDGGTLEIVPHIDIIRSITGHVWDDSRSLNNAGQYIGNGFRLFEEDSAIEDAKKNELVPIIKGSEVTEKKDIPVSSAKAEIIEIVETAENKYYEITPTDITCDYLQHVRTDADGAYTLHGYTPGKYVVRFTYGDEVEENETTEKQKDMYLFNGQDYKSTQYTMPDLTTGQTLDDNIVLYNKTDNEKNIDKIIDSLEAKNYNDARDDEIRRLEVNGYSEIMNNMIAEVLQGMANGTSLTNNNHENTEAELKALVDNTWMFAETIPFTVRAEKIEDKQKTKIQSIVENPTYATREQVEKQLVYSRNFKIENVDFGIEYRPENLIQLEKEIKEVKVTTESGEKVIDLFFNTEYGKQKTDPKKTHYLDTEKSVGLDLIQFISNEYNTLALGLISEKGGEDTQQGFVYINYDTDIQQGATVEITYELTAENHGEIDRISKNLDAIRYQDNYATKTLDATNNAITNGINSNGITNYRANITAANDMINNLYEQDNNGIFYRVSPKVLTATKGPRITNDTTGANGASGNKLSYYGYYVGYEYYTGEINDEFDTIGQLKFNKIIDYVDKDMEYLDNTTGSETLNKNWSVLDNTYKEYYSMIDWARSNPSYVAYVSNDECSKDDVQKYINAKLKDLDIVSAYEQMTNTDGFDGSLTVNTDVANIKGASIDPDGYSYNNMLLSADTGIYTDIYKDESRELSGIQAGTNPSLSRFLLPMVGDNTEEHENSRGKIELTVSKAISAETSGNELEYQNIAEIVEFTTLTGRRTNFAITIGNVDLRKNYIPEGPNDPNDPNDPNTPSNPSNPGEPTDNPNPREYPQSVPEPDESTPEVVTLIPPQGLYGRDKVIREVVQVAKTGTQIVVVIVAVVAIGTYGTMFGIRKYNKRRIK